MNRLLLILAFFFIATGAFANGRGGYFTLEGLMLDKAKNVPLANIAFVINGDTLKTDSRGRFNCKIACGSPCPTGLSWADIKRLTKKMNPPIKLIYHNKIKTIRNKWKRYMDKEESYSVILYW
jgi:hypothetical protein